MVGRQRTDSQQQTEMRPDDFVHQSLSSPSTSRSGYQRLQFRRMYRYGLSLLLVGALCNWIGFAQHYFAPVRYLGVGCVVAGALCICIAMCRWLSNRSNDSSASQEMACATEPNIHVIAVSVQSTDPFDASQQAILSKPPDYETAIGCKPPSYDEAVKLSPHTFFHLNSCPATSVHSGISPSLSALTSRPDYVRSDYPRCDVHTT